MSVPLAKVGALADQIRGVTYSKTEASSAPRPGFSPILRAGNITDAGLVYDTLVYVPNSCISGKQRLRLGDIVVAASSGSLDVVGKAARVSTEFEGGFGAFCKVLRPGPEVDPAYLAHYFATPEYRARISHLAAGININNIRSEHLDDLLIPLPPMAEQRRIAAILDKADELRAKRRAALTQLDTLTQAIFLDMFGDPMVGSPRAPRQMLGELLEGGPQNGLYRPASEYGSGTPIVRIDGFYNGVLGDPSGLKRLRIPDSEIERYGLRVGDVLINRVNSREYLGKSALIPHLSEPTVFESNMMRVRVDRRRLNPTYLIQFLQTQFARRHFQASAKDAVNQSSINQQDVKALAVPVPPVDLQETFARRIAAVNTLKQTQVLVEGQVSVLFAALQHRAFRGEL